MAVSHLSTPWWSLGLELKVLAGVEPLYKRLFTFD